MTESAALAVTSSRLWSAPGASHHVDQTMRARVQETQAAYSNGGLLSMWSRPALVHAASSVPPAVAQPLLSGGGGAANWAAVDAARRPAQPNGKVRGCAYLSGVQFSGRIRSRPASPELVCRLHQGPCLFSLALHL